MADIAHLRKEYQLKSLSETEVSPSPISQFSVWWNEALASEIEEANAMTLATASLEGVPSARIVLLKDYSANGFVFFTNYESAKGQDLAENPRATILFFWKELERQVKITGMAAKVSAADSDEYFLSRPAGSRYGAWASPQSHVIESRQWLENRVKEIETTMGANVQRPPHWGGYCIKPVIMEFWQGRPSRLHDRIQYSLEENGEWKIERLAP